MASAQHSNAQEMKKKTVVIGASANPERYAYKAIHSLVSHGHEVVPLGVKAGIVAQLPITTTKPTESNVDTVTLYVGPQNQPEWYDYIFGLNPRRIIFNPGTENAELVQLAEKRGIETVEGCTLVMLSVGTY
jgi:uncharacterized protein